MTYFIKKTLVGAKDKIDKKVLLIGGASRNVGKTSFVCRIIKSISKEQSIVALKIKTIYEGDNFFHGKDRSPLTSDYRLIEESDIFLDEDTSKMLRAGAKRAFKLKVKSHALFEAFVYFKSQIDPSTLIICESNSLRKILKPSVYLLIKHREEKKMKPSAKELAPLASEIIYTDGTKHNFDLERLIIKKSQWYLKSSQSHKF